MEVLRGFRDIALDVEGAVISIGNFDGVHRGHEAVISSAVGAARAAGLASVVCTFDPHTRVFLDPDKPPRLLETLGQRTRAIERLGVDITVVIPFERDVALQPHEDFVRDFLVRALRTRQIHVSKDFSFGAGGRGTIEYLRQVGPELGFELDIVAPVMSGGAPISSTRIRDALADGRVVDAAVLLGRPFTLSGNVVHGAGRGQGLDAPTANLDFGTRFTPGNGVYVTEVRLDGTTYDAVTNVGVRPTFGDGDDIAVETHLLDQSLSIYGEHISLAFLERLRAEVRFESADDLVAQIQRDIAAATKFFAARAGNSDGPPVG